MFFCLASVNANDITENIVSDSNSEIISISDDASADFLVEDNSLNELKISSEKDQITVKNSNSDSDLGISASNNAKSFTQLAKDINNASSVLNLTNDYKYNSSSDSTYKAGINITKTLTINGNNHNIDGNNLARIFNVKGNLTLNFITFVNCYADEYGGAVYNSGNLSVGNCSFVNCSARSSGGAIDNWYGNLSVGNCSFVNCSAGSSGGAVYNSGNLSVGNCSFVNCSANYGGAVNSWYGNLSFVSSRFVNCSASYLGGAIDNYNGDLLVVDSSFVNCFADNGNSVYNTGNFRDINNVYLENTETNNNNVYLENTETNNKNIIIISAITKKVGGSAVKKTLKFTLKTKYGKVLANKVVKLTINKKTYAAKSNANGIVMIKVPLTKAGSYTCTVRFNGDDNYLPRTWKAKIKVLKSLTTVKAPKVSGVRGTTKYFKVTVKYYKSKKVVKGLKLKVKVAGKSYTIKTNSKGVARLNIKNIKKGTHKVVISSKNSKFYVKKTSKIIIKNPVVKRTYKRSSSSSSSSSSRSSYSSSSSSSSSSTSRSFSINQV